MIKNKSKISITMWGFCIIPLVYLIACGCSGVMSVSLEGIISTFIVGGILDIGYNLAEYLMNR